MKLKKKGSGSGNVLEINFEGVEAGGGGRCPEGPHKVTVTKIAKEISDKSDKPYLAWEFKTDAGHNLYHNTSLQPQALFNLKGVLLGLGVEVPDGLLKVDIKALIGKTGTVQVIHEEYEGKTKARIDHFITTESEGDDEDDEDEDDEKVAEFLKTAKLEELIDFAKENDIDLTDLSKKGRKDRDRVAKAIKKAIEEDDKE